MKTLERGCIAALLAIAVAGCGGGNGGVAKSPQAAQASNGIAVGEPNPAALATAPFIEMARTSGCNETRNRLFVIDGKQVFWDHAGQCADASYGQTLYGATAKTVLCSHYDSIAGPRTSCQDEGARTLFDTMVAHLDQADLGLGGAHKVEPVGFLPKAGTVMPFTTVASSRMSGVATKQVVVIRDQAAWEKLWAQHGSYMVPAPALPQVDFTRQMLIGMFSTQMHDGCYSVGIGALTAGASKLQVEVDEVAPRPNVMCAMIAVNPMQVVAVDRMDADIDVVYKTITDLTFSALDTRQDSHVVVDRNVVVKDAAAFGRLWLEHTGTGVGLPQVDFTKDMVVGVFIGNRPTGIYATTIAAIGRLDDRVRVQRVDTVPSAGAVCTQAFVSPAQLVVVPRSDLPVEFTTQVQPLK
jgi:hypothetical protein